MLMYFEMFGYFIIPMIMSSPIITQKLCSTLFFNIKIMRSGRMMMGIPRKCYSCEIHRYFPFIHFIAQRTAGLNQNCRVYICGFAVTLFGYSWELRCFIFSLQFMGKKKTNGIKLFNIVIREWTERKTH